ncbi:MAG: S46 family peptidase [Flavobacteriales bacterium]
MWLLMLIKRLNYADMQREGLQLTPEEIYSVNHSSLASAIVNFNGYCTGEVVSPEGLIFTNHHCGYEAVAELSTEQNDYLKNGFWAYEKREELKPTSLFVSFFIRMADVTDRIQGELTAGMSEKARRDRIREISDQIIRENNGDGKYRVVVKPFFKGNEFYMFVYEDYPDVRLVGDPPASIGKFGGDTDNWEWPRHTGDFSIFRVYGDKDGNPAAYAADNVPLKPKYFLPIDIGGEKSGDFAMILGYPGGTDRYLPSWGVDQLVNVSYPAWVEASKSAMDVMKRHMDQNRRNGIDYASSYSQLANYWKNRAEMIKSLTAHKTAHKKRKIERRFARWARKKDRSARYGKVLSMLEDFYTTTNDHAIQQNYLHGIIQPSEMIQTVLRLNTFLKDKNYLQQPEEVQKAIIGQIYGRLRDIYAKMNTTLEKDLLEKQIELYADKVKPELQFSLLKEMQKDGSGGIASYIDGAFDHSIFSSLDRLTAFLNHPDASELDRDKLIALAQSLLEKYRNPSKSYVDKEKEMRKGYRLFLSGLLQMYPNKKFYPDANFSPRLTYGKVRRLPRDKRNDAKKNYYTTLKGVIAKYKPGDEEFDLPAKLIELYKAKDYGRYADADGSLHVDFLTDNDITGGNSGSPVINGKGALIGLAFDGNSEAMSGDVEFDKKRQRTISTDVRYVLFIIDKYAGATNLIREMKLVN